MKVDGGKSLTTRGQVDWYGFPYMARKFENTEGSGPNDIPPPLFKAFKKVTTTYGRDGMSVPNASTPKADV